MLYSVPSFEYKRVNWLLGPTQSYYDQKMRLVRYIADLSSSISAHTGLGGDGEIYSLLSAELNEAVEGIRHVNEEIARMSSADR